VTNALAYNTVAKMFYENGLYSGFNILGLFYKTSKGSRGFLRAFYALLVAHAALIDSYRLPLVPEVFVKFLRAPEGPPGHLITSYGSQGSFKWLQCALLGLPRAL
jgi:hypothetical protein